MPPSRYRIDTIEPGADWATQAAALEIALGVSLPPNLADWPDGLILAWNEAAEAGAFAGARTLGDLARAFLCHRLAERELRLPADARGTVAELGEAIARRLGQLATPDTRSTGEAA